MTETLSSRFEVRRASPLIGAEIEGVDFTQPADEATAEALREAFWSYKILVFRGQNLSPHRHVEAVRIFDVDSGAAIQYDVERAPPVVA